MEMREHKDCENRNDCKRAVKWSFANAVLYDQQRIEKTLAVLFRYHFIRTVLHHYGHEKCDNRLPRLKRSPVLALCLLEHLVLLHALSALG